MIRGALLLAACSLVACASNEGGPDYGAARRAQPELVGADAALLAHAIAELDGGRAEVARDELRRLADVRPESFAVQRWLQESEVAVARERADFLATLDAEEAIDPLVELREAYRERAEESGSATDLLLAARIEDDAPAALYLTDRALAADPDFGWAWYGRAHVAVRLGDWETARSALTECLARSPRHLEALRLSAWLQAEAGSRKAAIAELTRWLDLAPGDPTLAPGELESARLDLAMLLVQEGDTGEARDLLEGLVEADLDPVRLWTAFAAMYEARGDLLDALEATESAREADPDALLPVVQQALLVERHFNDPERALATWRVALQLAREQKDLGAVLQRTRAEVHIGRLERVVGGGPDPAVDDDDPTDAAARGAATKDAGFDRGSGRR